MRVRLQTLLGARTDLPDWSRHVARQACFQATPAHDLSTKKNPSSKASAVPFLKGPTNPPRVESSLRNGLFSIPHAFGALLLLTPILTVESAGARQPLTFTRGVAIRVCSMAKFKQSVSAVITVRRAATTLVPNAVCRLDVPTLNINRRGVAIGRAVIS